jgi:hypothetical protein
MSNSNDDRCLVRANLGVFGVDPTGEDKGFPPGVKDEDAAAWAATVPSGETGEGLSLTRRKFGLVSPKRSSACIID